MDKQKKTLWIAAGIAVAVVIAVILIAVSGGGTGAQEKVLQRFYDLMYVKGDSAMTQCLAPALQDQFYSETTLGGTNFNQMNRWRVEALELVGDNVSAKVKILRTGDESSADLKEFKAIHGSKLQRMVSVAFSLTLKGDEGEEEFLGVMPMLCIDGDWFLGSADGQLKRVVNESVQP